MISVCEISNTKMFSRKLTIATLLLLFSIAWPYLLVTVTGNPHPECTKEQKEKILLHCIAFVERGTPFITVHPESVCCERVRDVKNRSMSCIAYLLTAEERGKNDIVRLLQLHKICELKVKIVDYTPDLYISYNTYGPSTYLHEC